ncbi:hypothetical protein CFC21_016627 [Triticum aestivum]|uniref:Uncharacterized protein n=2 Tax=Triticum aestivum TaxID=4565 RepID=A0A9R1DZL6_WHEAT|nr:hypothetical protein CFC21_016627 [Triticum aestivum]
MHKTSKATKPGRKSWTTRWSILCRQPVATIEHNKHHGSLLVVGDSPAPLSGHLWLLPCSLVLLCLMDGAPMPRTHAPSPPSSRWEAAVPPLPRARDPLQQRQDRPATPMIGRSMHIFGPFLLAGLSTKDWEARTSATAMSVGDAHAGNQSLLGMLPGTWAYVSAGAFGRSIIAAKNLVAVAAVTLSVPAFRAPTTNIPSGSGNGGKVMDTGYPTEPTAPLVDKAKKAWWMAKSGGSGPVSLVEKRKGSEGRWGKTQMRTSSSRFPVLT